MAGGAVAVSRAAAAVLERSGFGAFQYAMLLVCGMANAADGVEILAVAFILPSATDDLQLTGLQKGWLTAMIFIGMMLGSWSWGGLADAVGRRPCLMYCLFMNGVFGLCSAFSPNFGWLLFFRFWSGFGVGGSIPVVFSYFAELLPVSHRSSFLIYMAMFWMVGGIFVSGVAWAIIPHDFGYGSFGLAGSTGKSSHFNSWRIFLVVSAMPALAVALSLIACPESPTWLLENGKWSRVTRTLRRIARINSVSLTNEEIGHVLKQYQDDVARAHDGKTPPLPTSSLSSSSSSKKRDHQHASSLSNGSSGDDNEHRSLLDPIVSTPESSAMSSDTDSMGIGGFDPPLARSVRKRRSTRSRRTRFRMKHCGARVAKMARVSMQLFAEKEHRTKSIVLAAVWFSLSFGFYGLTIWMPEYFSTLNSVSVYMSSFLTNVSNLPGSVASVIMVRRIGGARTLAWTMGLSGVCVFLIPTANSSASVVVVSCLFAAISVGGWNSLNLVTTGLYPTHLRSTAFGVFAAAGRIGAISGNLTFGEFLDANPIIPLFTVASCLVFGGLITLWLPPPYDEVIIPPTDYADDDIEDNHLVV